MSAGYRRSKSSCRSFIFSVVFIFRLLVIPTIFTMELAFDCTSSARQAVAMAIICRLTLFTICVFNTHFKCYFTHIFHLLYKFVYGATSLQRFTTSTATSSAVACLPHVGQVAKITVLS